VRDLGCRDISPSNIVVVRNPNDRRKYEQVLLLDLHAAAQCDSGGADAASIDDGTIVGKTLYMSLRLSEDNPQHSLATDLESLFLTCVYEVIRVCGLPSAYSLHPLSALTQCLSMPVGHCIEACC
jgi:serine/threonine protein kinase